MSRDSFQAGSPGESRDTVHSLPEGPEEAAAAGDGLSHDDLESGMSGVSVRRADSASSFEVENLGTFEVAVKKRHFLRCHIYRKGIISPRQARDKHREHSKKEWRFLRGGKNEIKELRRAREIAREIATQCAL
jgi:hypothetical protein